MDDDDFYVEGEDDAYLEDADFEDDEQDDEVEEDDNEDLNESNELKSDVDTFDSLVEKIKNEKNLLKKIKLIQQAIDFGKKLKGEIDLKSLVKLYGFVKEEYNLKTNVLPKIKARLQQTNSCVLTFGEQNNLRKAKQHSALKKEVDEIKRIKLKNLFVKIGKAVIYILPWLLLGLIALAVMLGIAHVIDSLFGWLIGSGGGSSKPKAQFGANGASFYGTRVLYRDEEQAHNDLIEDYIGLIDNSVSAIVKETDNYVLTIDLVFPEDEIDLATLDANVLSILEDMVDVVYQVDNPLDYDLLKTLDEKLDLIKYFGFDANIKSDFESIIYEGILLNTSAQSKPDLQPLAITNGDEIDVLIRSAVNAVVNAENVQRFEKLYIKDYVFEDDEKMMENVETEQYLAMIFLPKSDVEFTYFSFLIFDVDFDKFNSLKIFNGDVETEIKKQDELFTSVDDGGIDSYLWETEDGLNLRASAIALNLPLSTNERSLFDIAKSQDTSTIFTSSSDENGINYSTFIPSGVRVEFDCDEQFCFVEYETSVK